MGCGENKARVVKVVLQYKLIEILSTPFRGSTYKPVESQPLDAVAAVKINVCPQSAYSFDVSEHEISVQSALYLYIASCFGE